MSEMNMHRALSPTATQSMLHVINCLSANTTAYDMLLRIHPCIIQPLRVEITSCPIMRTEWIFPTHTDQDGSVSPSPAAWAGLVGMWGGGFNLGHHSQKHG